MTAVGVLSSFESMHGIDGDASLHGIDLGGVEAGLSWAVAVASGPVWEVQQQSSFILLRRFVNGLVHVNPSHFLPIGIASKYLFPVPYSNGHARNRVQHSTSRRSIAAPGLIRRVVSEPDAGPSRFLQVETVASCRSTTVPEQRITLVIHAPPTPPRARDHVLTLHHTHPSQAPSIQRRDIPLDVIFP